ncbi:MAG: ATP-binding protein [Rubrivivax sp.]|nr:ATP-binding protein [Rubrivivax sp.]
MSADAEKRILLPSRLDRLGALRQEVYAFAEAHGLAPLAAEDLGLCVHEAASNAMVHGNGDDETQLVEVVLIAEVEGIRVTVTNGGPGFDHESLPGGLVPGDRPRGRGLRIIHRLAQDVTWSDQGRSLSFLKSRG